MKELNWKLTGKRCALALAAVAAAVLCICMALSWMIQQEWLQPEAAGQAGPVLGALCLFGGCAYAAGKASNYRMQISCLTALCYIGLLLLVKLVLFSQLRLTLDWRWLLPACSAVGAGLLSSRPKKYHR